MNTEKLMGYGVTKNSRQKRSHCLFGRVEYMRAHWLYMCTVVYCMRTGVYAHYCNMTSAVCVVSFIHPRADGHTLPLRSAFNEFELLETRGLLMRQLKLIIEVVISLCWVSYAILEKPWGGSIRGPRGDCKDGHRPLSQGWRGEGVPTKMLLWGGVTPPVRPLTPERSRKDPPLGESGCHPCTPTKIMISSTVRGSPLSLHSNYQPLSVCIVSFIHPRGTG